MQVLNRTRSATTSLFGLGIVERVAPTSSKRFLARRSRLSSDDHWHPVNGHLPCAYHPIRPCPGDWVNPAVRNPVRLSKVYSSGIPNTSITHLISTHQFSSAHLFHTSAATTMAENKYSVDYAKMGTSKCKKCKQPIAKKDPRIAKHVSNPFSDDGSDMKQYHHPACMFETFLRARATTKKIEDPSDLEGFENMEEAEKKMIRKLIDGRWASCRGN